jgi:hypothetical protein
MKPSVRSFCLSKLAAQTQTVRLIPKVRAPCTTPHQIRQATPNEVMIAELTTKMAIQQIEGKLAAMVANATASLRFVADSGQDDHYYG